ncbi:Spherulation-specific family 4 [compost metagenome]
MNPASGPGLLPDAAYVAGIARLTRAGIRVIGYVATGYGALPANAVALDLARWRQHYPAVGGVFLDEVPTQLALRFHYGQIAADARRHGFTLVVGNAGISTDLAFAEWLDVLIAYEQPGWPGPGEPSAELANRFGKQKFGMLAYETATFTPEAAATAASRFGWVYVTEDAQPNPWDTLSGHAEAIADALD